MKKRIGTKLYNTETADCVSAEIGLYRQHKKQSYFIYDGKNIKAIDNDAAKELLRQHGIQDVITRKPGKNGDAKLGVSPASADRLANYCRSHGVTQKKVLEDFISTLVP